MALLGVEMVKADNEDPESLLAAFEGAYSVFGITGEPFDFFRAIISEETELIYPVRLTDCMASSFVLLRLIGPNTHILSLVWTLFPLHAGDGPTTRDHETQHAKNQIDAAKKAGVQHFVWSTLDKLEQTEVFHFTSKFNGA